MSPQTKVTVTHVYITRGVVSAWVITGKPLVHKVGHQPWLGWVCTCSRGKRCPQIKAVKALLPVQAIEAGAAGVVAGRIQPGVCTPDRGPVNA